MMKPLALIWYERLLPGSQLVNRLDGLGYRVRHEPDPESLSASIQREGPLILLVDLQSANVDVVSTIRRLKNDPATQHIAVLAFAPDHQKGLQDAAAAAGADLVAGNSAVLDQLPQLLEHALRVD
jgi:CheY-like chemotaxis protein